MPDSPQEQPKNRFSWFKDSVVLLIAALTLVSTTFQFYVRDYLTPQRKPTALEISTRLEPVGERRGMSLVRVAVRATNPTDRRIYVPAIWFSVFGFGLPPRPCDADTDWQKALASADELLHSSFNPPASINIVAQRQVFADGSAWYEPKDVTNFEDIVAVPTGRYDFLKLLVQYIQARSLDALDEKQPIEWKEQDGIWYATARYKVKSPTADVEFSERAGGGLNIFETVLALGGAGASQPGVRQDAAAPPSLAQPSPCAR